MSVLPVSDLARRRAAIYVRISKDPFGDQLGVARQRKLCRELAERNGWEVVATFSDNDTSAFRKRKPRKGFIAMLEAVEAGEADAIVAYAFDRLSRSDMRAVEDLIDLLQNRGVAWATVRSGDFDLSTADGRANARQAAVYARRESEKASERLTDKMTELRDAGAPNGGPRPFGWKRTGRKPANRGDDDTRKLVSEPTEAPIVAEMIIRVAAGETLTRIAEDLNERGSTTAQGKPWTLTNVRRVVLNGTHAGLRMHKGEVAGRGSWHDRAIVDERTWRRAVHALVDRNRDEDGQPRRRSARRYLLSGGLLQCGKCGKPLFSKQLHTGRGLVPAYACRPSTQGGCGGVTVRAEETETFVTDRVIDYVESAAFARELARRHSGDAKASASIAHLEARLDQLADERADEVISDREWTRMRDKTMQRLAEARVQTTTDTAFAAVGRFAGQSGKLAEAWAAEDMSLDQRQAIVRAVVDHITAAPLGRSGPRVPTADRLTITWR